MKEKLIINAFKSLGGKHCQTSALKAILEFHSLKIKEEMLLGLGGGIGFIYWYMKVMPCPFIGTRTGGNNEAFLMRIAEGIGAKAYLFETSSSKKGYEEIKHILRQGEPAYTFVDMAYLPYMAMPEEAHFGGHTIVVYGIDEEEDKVYISDRASKPVSITIDDLMRARSSKHHPMQPSNRLIKFILPDAIGDLRSGIREGILCSCNTMLNPPLKNFGLEGIKKWAGLVEDWDNNFKGMNLLGCLLNTFIYIEIGGTGGSAFRTMYADFLHDAAKILDKPRLDKVSELYLSSAKHWDDIAKASLPDDFESLREIRRLMILKNKVFEEQKDDALEKALSINMETDEWFKKALTDLEERDIKPLLKNMKEKILECYKIEKHAISALYDAIR